MTFCSFWLAGYSASEQALATILQLMHATGKQPSWIRTFFVKHDNNVVAPEGSNRQVIMDVIGQPC
jgi:hypothetical protein